MRERSMRRWFLLPCLWLLSVTALPGQSGSNPRKTIEGCVISINGVFTMGTPNGDHYILKGNRDTLFSYNGMQVRITGTVKNCSNGSSASPGEPCTLQVSKIKKVYDVCQF